MSEDEVVKGKKAHLKAKQSQPRFTTCILIQFEHLNVDCHSFSSETTLFVWEEST